MGAIDARGDRQGGSRVANGTGPAPGTISGSSSRAPGVRGGKDRIRRVEDVDALADGATRDALRRQGVGALVDAPVTVDGDGWGELRLESASPRRWHADEAALAGYFADVHFAARLV